MNKYAIATSDWHLREERPINRKPGFQKQQYEKIMFIMELCSKYDADLYNAGDVFDKPRQSRKFVSKYLRLFKQYPEVLHVACAGQHDQIYHSKNIADTSIELLFASGWLHNPQNPALWAADWGSEMSVSTDRLIAHYCVTERPNEFIEYSLTASQFLAATKARIAVTGDFHDAHYLEEDGRLLVNPGSPMRLGVDSVNKKPSVYLIDTEKAEVIDQIFLPIHPGEEVFDLVGVKRKKESEKLKEEMADRFEDYLKRMSEYKTERPDFHKNLEKLVVATCEDEDVKKEIDTMVTGG